MVYAKLIRVNIQEAKTHLSRYIDRVEQGEVVIVCRHNQPVAELRAVETSPVRPARVAGLLKGQVHWDRRYARLRSGEMKIELEDPRNAGYKPVFVRPQPFSFEEILRSVDPTPNGETEPFVVAI